MKQKVLSPLTVTAFDLRRGWGVVREDCSENPAGGRATQHPGRAVSSLGRGRHSGGVLRECSRCS